MCSENAGNVISEPLVLKIFQGGMSLDPLRVSFKYEPNQTKPKLYVDASIQRISLKTD